MNKKLLIVPIVLALGAGAYFAVKMWGGASLRASAYTLPEIGISIGTLNGYACEKSQSHIDHPDWVQIACYPNGVTSGDPYVFLNNAPSYEREKFTVVASRKSTVDGKAVAEFVFHSKVSGDSYGFVEYVYEGETPERSFQMILPFGVNKPHASSEAASAIGRAIVQSITFE